MEVIRTSLDGIDLFQLVELEVGPDVQIILDHLATISELSKTSWLFPNYVSHDGAFKSVVQSFVLHRGERVIVVDTCLGNDKVRADHPHWSHLQTDFLAAFERTGLAVEEVTDVLCTHMHLDHVGWNTLLRDGRWVPTFPNARYYFSRTEYDHWRSQQAGSGGDNQAAFRDSIQPVVDAKMAVLVDDDADLGDGISLVPTPGHTPGHVSVRIGAASCDIYISGDSIHHPCQIAHVEWSTKIDFDQRLAVESRRKLLGLASQGNAFLAGTHFAVPSVGRIMSASDGEYYFLGIAETRI